GEPRSPPRRPTPAAGMISRLLLADLEVHDRDLALGVLRGDDELDPGLLADGLLLGLDLEAELQVLAAGQLADLLATLLVAAQDADLLLGRLGADPHARRRSIAPVGDPHVEGGLLGLLADGLVLRLRVD